MCIRDSTFPKESFIKAIGTHSNGPLHTDFCYSCLLYTSMWAAELLLRMKEQQAYQDVELCLALPFQGYNADWDDWHRKRMDFICRYAEKVLVLGEMPSSESYKKRNYYMVCLLYTSQSGLSWTERRAYQERIENSLLPFQERRKNLFSWRYD